jgi:predicted dehydrogenase
VTARVRVGVVGTTWYAETHLKNLASHPAVELAAIAGRDAGKATAVAERWGIPRVFGSHEELLAAGLIDAIVIVAPDELHAPIAVAAAARGIHVLCEKPLATNAAEARAMADAVAAAGVVNMSFFAMRTSVHHRYLKALVDDGFVGRVSSARFHLEHGFFRGADYQWRFDSRRGTGALGDLGSYVFDHARWLIGDITEIAVDLATHVDRPAPDGEPYPAANDSAVGMLRFAEGAHATFSTSVVAHQAEGKQTNTILLNGSAGTLELVHTFAGARLRGARGSDETFQDIDIPAEFWGDVDPTEPGTAGQHHSVGDRAFIDAILRSDRVRPDFVDGWHVQQVIDAAFVAADTGTWARVGDPALIGGRA